MLYKDFNKLGDTTFRVKSQVQGYKYLINWLTSKEFNDYISQNDISLEKDSKIINKLFCEKLRQEEIYNYTNDKFNRFELVVSSKIIKKFHLLEIKNNQFVFHQDFDVNDQDNSFIKIIQNNFNENSDFPFKKMLEFLHSFPNKNNAFKIALAFFVYDGNETFNELYHMNIIEKVAENIGLNFRKHPNCYKTIKKIQELKNEKQMINKEILIITKYNYEKDNYIKKLFFKKKERFDYQIFLDKINKINLEDFNYQLSIIRAKQLLEKEYLDLFYRWLNDFNIKKTNSTKDHSIQKHIIKKSPSGNFYVKKSKQTNDYPFTKQFVIDCLVKIQKNNFKWKINNSKTISIANSCLAEYFVNLYFCYFFNIKKDEAFKFVNTKVDDDFFPYFTAPGKKADMSYYSKDKFVFNIETTILKTNLQITNNEIFPCINHMQSQIKEFNPKKVYLFFISLIDSKEIEIRFKRNFDSEILLQNKKIIFKKIDDLNQLN